MTQNRSREDLIRFLDYMGDKGLTPPATASARKTAATKVLAVLDDMEAVDVINIDLDDVMSRFDNLNRHQFTPESLQTYRSRLKTALKDFAAYSENPVNFRPQGQSRNRAPQKVEKVKAEVKSPSVRDQPARDLDLELDLPNVSVLPIPLRQHLTVRIVGLPFDLSIKEAKKIANIILAHAMPDD